LFRRIVAECVVPASISGNNAWAAALAVHASACAAIFYLSCVEPVQNFQEKTMNEKAEDVGQHKPQPDEPEGAGQVVAVAGQLAEEARSRGASVASDAKDHVMSAAEGHREAIAGQVSDVAESVHQAAEQFQGKQDWVAQVVERGATELGTLAETLRTNDLQGLMDKLQDLARRQPAIFVGAAMAAGFGAVRLGKVAVAGASKSDLPSMPEVFRESK
jgi:hypothetical protein